MSRCCSRIRQFLFLLEFLFCQIPSCRQRHHLLHEQWLRHHWNSSVSFISTSKHLLVSFKGSFPLERSSFKLLSSLMLISATWTQMFQKQPILTCLSLAISVLMEGEWPPGQIPSLLCQWNLWILGLLMHQWGVKELEDNSSSTD